MLKLQFKDRRRESVWLVDSRFTIGKSSSNSLMIEDASIAELHAEIINTNDALFLEKKSASSSVKVNGLELTGRQAIKANDSITIGKVVLELIDSKSLSTNQPKQATLQIWSLHSSASWLEKQDFIINQKTIIGRDPECDICLTLDYLSRKHISLEPLNGKLWIEDLNSSNGTFVNGLRIQKTELKPGDKIKLDVLTFEVRGPGASNTNDPHKTIIRSVPNNPPANKQATPAPALSTINSTTTQAKSTKEQERPKARAPGTPKAATNVAKRKRLAADGKQVWISGDNQLKPKPEKKKSYRGLLLIIAVILLIGAGLIYAFTG